MGRQIDFDLPRAHANRITADQTTRSWVVTVKLSIEPEQGGCFVTLVHEMDKAWAEYVPRTEQGWGRMLRAIESLIASAQT